MRHADLKAVPPPSSAERDVAIRLTEDMYEAIVQELGRRSVSHELRDALRGARSFDLQRPWPEREYVVECSKPVSAELLGHLEKTLRRSGGVRRGTLSRALLRIADGQAASSRDPSASPAGPRSHFGFGA